VTGVQFSGGLYALKGITQSNIRGNQEYVARRSGSNLQRSDGLKGRGGEGGVDVTASKRNTLDSSRNFMFRTRGEGGGYPRGPGYQKEREERGGQHVKKKLRT